VHSVLQDSLKTFIRRIKYPKIYKYLSGFYSVAQESWFWNQQNSWFFLRWFWSYLGFYFLVSNQEISLFCTGYGEFLFEKKFAVKGI
jgi:hypothetical protein